MGALYLVRCLGMPGARSKTILTETDDRTAIVQMYMDLVFVRFCHTARQGRRWQVGELARHCPKSSAHLGPEPARRRPGAGLVAAVVTASPWPPPAAWWSSVPAGE